MLESKVLQGIQNAAPLFKCRLFRNNVGLFHVTDHGRRRTIKTGLCNGSSDLVGYTKKVITKDMVGQNIAIFTAIETKKSDWKKDKKLNTHESKQKEFIDMVKKDGGIADFSNSVEDFINIIDN
jgi:hypothetical protein